MKRLTFNYCKEPPAENLRTFRLPLAKYWYYPASLANQKLRLISPGQWGGSIPLRIFSALRRAINDIVYSVIPVTFNRPNNRVILILHTRKSTTNPLQWSNCTNMTTYLAYLGYSIFYSHILMMIILQFAHGNLCDCCLCVWPKEWEFIDSLQNVFIHRKKEGVVKKPQLCQCPRFPALVWICPPGCWDAEGAQGIKCRNCQFLTCQPLEHTSVTSNTHQSWPNQ